jgi:CspA family cold shock protein
VETATERETGTVRKWIPEKGYGFLSLPGNDERIFCHHTAIMAKERNGAIVPFRGYRQLFEGQKVEFDLAQCQKGFEALRVVAITGEP